MSKPRLPGFTIEDTSLWRWEKNTAATLPPPCLKVWWYAYSWQEVRYATMEETEDYNYELSHWCMAPIDADPDYLSATGHYAWAHGLGD